MKMPSKPKNGLNGAILTKFSQDQILRALYDLDDLMWRCLTQTNYLSLGDIGKAMKENVDFDGKELEFGIESRYVTPEVMSTLKSYTLPDTVFTETGFSYKFGEVPVKVKFIKRRYHFFEHPEKLIYGAGEFQIPNPFEKYVKARWIIQ